MMTNDKKIPKIAPSNTKKEMLEAFNRLKTKYEEQAKAQLKPEKVKAEKIENETIRIADTVTTDNIIKRGDNLKSEIIHSLTDITNKLQEETERYRKVKEAIAVKDKELNELFEIEKSAFTLAALLETHKQKSAEFEEKMAQEQATFQDEMENKREEWGKEKQWYLASFKEQQAEDQKKRQREKEEYEYNYKREKEQKKRKLEDELAQIAKEIEMNSEDFEKQVSTKEDELNQREIKVSEKEKLLEGLQQKVDAFPKELESAVNKAIKETTDTLLAEAKKNEQLLIRQYEGEKNVLSTKIESLEKVVSNQIIQIETLSKQLENSYGKVQDIAVKAVASTQNLKFIPTAFKTPAQESEK
jgi:hypothetical protein